MSGDYSTDVVPAFFENTRIEWEVVESPSLSVEWGWTGQGSWFIGEGEGISFTIERIIEDVEGYLQIGNFSIVTSNTDIARELVFGVWGLTPFFPGFVVPVGPENLENLNETAYSSAARVKNNYLNGSMVSQYGQLTVGGEVYDCIIFDYFQDPSGFGEPQVTHLAYDIESGILVSGNTSVTFDNPYVLHIELASVTRVSTTNYLLIGIVSVGGLVVVVVAVFLSREK